MTKRFGTPVPTLAKEITEGECVPGLGWEVSDETKRELDEIDENIRQAHINAHLLVCD